MDLPGEEFLLFYAVVCVASLALSWVVQKYLRFPLPDGRLPDLDAEDVAVLNGGVALLVASVLASLVRRGLVNIGERRVFLAGHEEPDDLTPMEKGVLHAIPVGGAWSRSLIDSITPFSGSIRRRLQAQGLLMSDAFLAFSLALTWLPVVSAAMLGFVKVGVGLSREKPALYLAIEVLTFLITSVALLAKTYIRSRRGDAVLIGMRSRLRVDLVSSSSDSVPARDRMLSVALLGVGSLAGTDLYDELLPIMLPVTTKKRQWGSGKPDWDDPTKGSSNNDRWRGGGSGCGGCSSS